PSSCTCAPFQGDSSGPPRSHRGSPLSQPSIEADTADAARRRTCLGPAGRSPSPPEALPPHAERTCSPAAPGLPFGSCTVERSPPRAGAVHGVAAAPHRSLLRSTFARKWSIRAPSSPPPSEIAPPLEPVAGVQRGKLHLVGHDPALRAEVSSRSSKLR